jgi:hypothetical protein
VSTPKIRHGRFKNFNVQATDALLGLIDAVVIYKHNETDQSDGRQDNERQRYKYDTSTKSKNPI